MKIMLMSRFSVHRHDPASTVAEKCVTNSILYMIPNKRNDIKYDVLVHQRNIIHM